MGAGHPFPHRATLSRRQKRSRWTDAAWGILLRRRRRPSGGAPWRLGRRPAPFVFSLVNLGVGGGVDQEVRSPLGERMVDAGRIADVELLGGWRSKPCPGRRRRQQSGANLPGSAGDENFAEHLPATAASSPAGWGWRRPGGVRSGQSMASWGSFQISPRSSSGR